MRVPGLFISARFIIHITLCYVLVRCIAQFVNNSFIFGSTTSNGPGPPHSRDFLITHNDTPHSVGILWTSDQLVAETST
jgi:hypothetical protein